MDPACCRWARQYAEMRELTIFPRPDGIGLLPTDRCSIVRFSLDYPRQPVTPRAPISCSEQQVRRIRCTV